MAKELRSGYSTGTHATAVLGSVLSEYYQKDIKEVIDVTLPQGEIANITVKYEDINHFSTIKVDNDDIDVTKGCCIHVELFEKKPTLPKTQEPSLLELGCTKLYIYAGDGIGVVTKKGLKIAPTHPAINPVPLEMMHNIALGIVDKQEDKELHAVFSVDNGEEIAKQTANAKVGVIGGISILGTRGIVKPVSSSAYIDSIEAEIDVIAASECEEIVFTLGNSAHDYAKKYYDESQIVEIGNFVYDASVRLKNKSFKKMIFITSVAKMCKVAQEFKNTHNKYGTIDFDEVKIWVKDELGVDFADEEFLTLKAVMQSLKEHEVILFASFLGYKAGMSFKKWFEEIGLDIKDIEIITLENGEGLKRELKW